MLFTCCLGHLSDMFFRIFLNLGVPVFYFLFFCNGVKAASNRYQVMVRHVQECVSPQPPYSRKRSVIPTMEIYTNNGRAYIRGNTTIKSPVPFRNFSAQSFQQTSGGHRDVKFHILNVSCHNYVAAAMFYFANISFTKKNCLLQRGFYPYCVDVDKSTHLLPIWHARGLMVHRFQLVADGVTAMCAEAHMEVKSRP